MVQGLAGCREKIVRAKELTQEVEEQITALMASSTFTVVRQDQSDLNRYAFWVDGPAVPLRIAVIAGEVAHHLRSALDHVIWALALTTTPNPWHRIQFPVSETRKKFNDAIKDDLLKGVPKAAHPLIEAIQPYMAGPADNSILKILHTMDIVDKHRLLIVLVTAMLPGEVISVNAAGPGFSIILPDPKHSQTPFHYAIEHGREVQWIRYENSTRAQVEIENEFTVEIAFSEVGLMARQPVVPTLQFLCSAVENYVTNFERFFS